MATYYKTYIKHKRLKRLGRLLYIKICKVIVDERKQVTLDMSGSAYTYYETVTPLRSLLVIVMSEQDTE